MPEPIALLEPSPVLVAARANRSAVDAKLDALLKTPVEEARSLTVEETEQLRTLSADRENLNAQVTALEADEVRKADVARLAAQVDKDGDSIVRVGAEPHTYEEHHHSEPWSPSFMRDLGIVTLYGRVAGIGAAAGGIDGATARLQRHMREMFVDSEHSPELRNIVNEYRETKPEMREQADKALGESRVAPNLTAGTGGDLIPPLYQIQNVILFQRAARVAANRVTQEPLPAGTSSVSIPRITTPTLTGLQVAPGSPIVSQDFKTKTVTGNVQTLAGQTDIDQQLIDFSPLNIDQFVFRDSSQDLDQKTDQLVIAGVAGVTASTTRLSPTSAYLPAYTAATAATMYTWGLTQGIHVALGSGAANIAQTRFMPATGIWMSPRRWYHMVVFGVDTLGRPLIEASAEGPYNAVISPDVSNAVSGFVANHPLGPPILLDANMPITVNGSTDLTTGSQDMTLILKEDDVVLYEGAPRMRAMVEPLSGTLQVRFQIWNYVILIPNRFEASISMLRGAGGTDPSTTW